MSSEKIKKVNPIEEYFKESARIINEKTKSSKIIIGEIISNSIWIDKLLDEIIAKSLIKKEKREIFYEKIISIGGITTSMKIEIIKKTGLFEDKEIVNSLKQLFENRNIIAHCYRPGHPETLEHPKKGYLDLLKIEEDFNKKLSKVTSVLLTILKNI